MPYASTSVLAYSHSSDQSSQNRLLTSPLVDLRARHTVLEEEVFLAIRQLS